MKNCKKIALLVIVFILSTALHVYAENTEILLTASKTEVKVGDTVTITVSAKCDNGVEGIDSTLEYDKTKLKLTNEASLAGTGYVSMSGTTGTDESTGEFKLSLLYAGSEETPTEATVATLTFEVLEAATVGEKLSVKVSKIELADSDFESVLLTDSEIELEVVEATDDDGDGEGDGTESGDGEGDGTGSGEGEGDGTGSGDGEGDGTGSGDGEGDGTGSGEGEGDGTESGDGEGDGTGSGDGEGDGTAADKDFNYAGLETYAFIVIPVIAVIAIAFYAKYKKYKDVK